MNKFLPIPQSGSEVRDELLDAPTGIVVCFPAPHDFFRAASRTDAIPEHQDRQLWESGDRDQCHEIRCFNEHGLCSAHHLQHHEAWRSLYGERQMPDRGHRAPAARVLHTHRDLQPHEYGKFRRVYLDSGQHL